MGALEAIEPLLYVPYLWRGRDPAIGLDCWGASWNGLRMGFGVQRPIHMVDDEALDPKREIVQIATSEKRSGRWINIPCDVQPFRPSQKPRPGDVLVLRIRKYPVHMCLVVHGRLMLQTQDGELSRLVDYARDPMNQYLYRIIEHWRPIELHDG